MLHMRVIAPAGLLDPVVDLLTKNPGVTHIVVHRDAALVPQATRSPPNWRANPPTTSSTRAYRAEEEAERAPADAVVGDELVARTREESTLNGTFMAFL
jgi:hypothetical protein